MAPSQVTILLLLCCISSLSGQAEISFNYNQVNIKLLGRSGRVVIGPQPLTKQIDDKTVWLAIDELQEYDDQSNAIGRYRSPKHFYNKFSQLDFVFSERVQTEYRDDLGAELMCTNVNMTSSFYDLGQGVKVTLMIYVFGEDGVLTNENEKLGVKKGNVKVNFQVSMKTVIICIFT